MESLDQSGSKPCAIDSAPEGDVGAALYRTKVECICPGCRRTHSTLMRWSGRGMPRVFCPPCRNRDTALGPDDD